MTAVANRTNKAFTLTELLVVMSVIIILLSMLVVCVDGIFTHAARMQCQHQMEQIWHACLLYANANRVLPNAWDFSQGRPWYAQLGAEGYLDNPDAYHCPSSDITSSYGSGLGSHDPGSPAAAYDGILHALNWMNNPANQTNHAASGGVTWNIGQEGNRPPYAAKSALAALSFMGAGCTINHPTYGESLEKALRFIMWHSDAENGNIASYSTSNYEQYDNFNYGQTRGYDQGLCVMALCDAYRMMGDVLIGDRSLMQEAQRATSALAQINEYLHPVYGSFYYQGWWCDNSASSWGWQGLLAGNGAGFIDLNSTTYKPLMDSFAERCAEYDGTGWYWGSRFEPHGGDNHPDKEDEHWRFTPATMAVRLMTGMAHDDPRIQLQVNWIKQNYGGRNTFLGLAEGELDLYASYYMTLALYQYGGSEWEAWSGKSIQHIIDNKTEGATTEEWYWDLDKADGSNYAGYIFPTALAAMNLEMAAGEYIPSSRYNVSAAGEHSYGYNKLIASDQYGRRTPAGNTIVLIDYMRSGIDPADRTNHIAPRHGGKANVFFGDGHTEALTVDELTEEDPDSPGVYRIKSHMLSLQGGSDPVPV
ncbi:MAG: type II secretion system protein, partial [Lentisphaerae bacterium]|nr:type II secretion system protein [Lentisphaerota bacterium]